MGKIYEKLVKHNIYAILVKNKEEVVAAAELLEKIGVVVFKNYSSKVDYLASDKHVENNYLIKEKGDDDGWRIQSHFISDETTIEYLEKKINEILTETPEIKVEVLQEEISELKGKVSEYEKRIEEITKILNQK